MLCPTERPKHAACPPPPPPPRAPLMSLARVRLVLSTGIVTMFKHDIVTRPVTAWLQANTSSRQLSTLDWFVFKIKNELVAGGCLQGYF